MHKSKSGFTIVEISVVIVIIGILVTLVALSFSRVQASARDTQRSSRTAILADALEKYYDNNGEYPSCSSLTQSATVVDTSVLPGIDPAVLLTPRSVPADTNSIKCSDLTIASTSPDIFAYLGDGSTDCASGASCLSWTLKYTDESSGTVKTIQSRRKTILSGGSGCSVVTTLAGSGTQGSADGAGSAAQFKYPVSVAVDSSGTVYVGDSGNNRIRKITSAGVVTTLAGGTYGFADGTGSAAQFYSPEGVAVDSSGTVYVADAGNNRIRKITSAGVVTTLAGSGTYGFADGTGSTAQFNHPYGVAVDSSGTVYVADSGTYYVGDAGNSRIRKITSAGVVTTLAGGTPGSADGTGSAAQFYDPTGVAVDSSGTVYVADEGNSRIRKITSAGVVTTLAGGTYGFADGACSTAQFYGAYNVAVDSSGTVYVADQYNNRIRKIQ